MKKYKHKFVSREIVNNRGIIINYKVREIKDKTGITWWLLSKKGFRANKKIACPPYDAIDITEKGRKHVEAYHKGGDEYIYIMDNGITSDEKFKPFTSNQRSLLVDQLSKSKLEGGIDWKQNIPAAIMWTALIIIVAILIFGIPDILEKHADLLDKMDKTAQKFIDANVQIAQIQNDVQVIKAEIIKSPQQSAPN